MLVHWTESTARLVVAGTPSCRSDSGILAEVLDASGNRVYPDGMNPNNLVPDFQYLIRTVGMKTVLENLIRASSTMAGANDPQARRLTEDLRAAYDRANTCPPPKPNPPPIVVVREGLNGRHLVVALLFLAFFVLVAAWITNRVIG